MSEQNPYEQLGVTEGASFEEIQAARDRLCTEYEGDPQHIQAIEAAYDSVLMDRLKQRQEGRIKVPDRIRFPERVVQPAPSNPPALPTAGTPGWVQQLVDTPSWADIGLPGGILAGLSALVIFAPASLQFSVLAGTVTGLYFLYRKEKKLGRTVLLGFGGMIVGLLLGGLIATPLQPLLLNLGMRLEVFSAVFTFLLLWLISSFLK